MCVSVKGVSGSDKSREIAVCSAFHYFLCVLCCFSAPPFAVCFGKMNPLLLQGLPENVRSLLLLDENLPESVAWKDMVLFQDISQDVGVTGIRRTTAGGCEKTTYGFSLSLPLLEG
jgi:hypothetical protein